MCKHFNNMREHDVHFCYCFINTIKRGLENIVFLII